MPNPMHHHQAEPPNPRGVNPSPEKVTSRGGDSQATQPLGGWLPPYLGLVPLLGLLDVAGGHGLVLAADVAQGGRQVRLACVHLDVHPLPGQLLLQLPQLLGGTAGFSLAPSRAPGPPRAGLPPRGPCGGRLSRPAGSPPAVPGPGETRRRRPRPATVGDRRDHPQGWPPGSAPT